MKKTRLLYLLIGFGAVLAAFLFRSSIKFELIPLEYVIRLVDAAKTHQWISWGYYLLYVVGVMALPITIFPIVGGVLFPFWISFPMNVLAATTGGWLSFMVTRRWGRAAAHSYLRKKFKTLDAFSKTEGFKAVLILRLIGIPPFLVSNYALGFSGVRQVDFWTGTMAGIMPWMGIVTYLANSLWEAILVGGEKGLAKALAHAMGPMMIVSFTIVGVMFLNYWLKRKRYSNL